MTKTPTLNSCNVTASHFYTLMHQMSQKILSASEKYACLQRLNRRRDKVSAKVAFKKNYLILNGSKYFCSKNKKNEAMTLYRVFYHSAKSRTGGTRKRQKILAGIRQIIFW